MRFVKIIVLMLLLLSCVLWAKKWEFTSEAGVRVDSNVLNTLNIDEEIPTAADGIKGWLDLTAAYLLHDCGTAVIKPSFSVKNNKYFSKDPAVYTNDNTKIKMDLLSSVTGDVLKKKYELSLDYSYQYTFADIDADHNLKFNLFENSFTPGLSYEVFGKNMTSFEFPVAFYLNRYEAGENDARESGINFVQAIEFIKDYVLKLKGSYGEYNSKNDLADNKTIYGKVELKGPLFFGIKGEAKFGTYKTSYDNSTWEERKKTVYFSLKREVYGVALSSSYLYKRITGDARYKQSVFMFSAKYKF